MSLRNSFNIGEIGKQKYAHGKVTVKAAVFLHTAINFGYFCLYFAQISAMGIAYKVALLW